MFKEITHEEAMKAMKAGDERLRVFCNPGWNKPFSRAIFMKDKYALEIPDCPEKGCKWGCGEYACGLAACARNPESPWDKKDNYSPAEEKKAEPEGEWEICDVTRDTDCSGVLCWCFKRAASGKRRWGIEWCVGMVGFGGIEYKEAHGDWYVGAGLFFKEDGLPLSFICQPGMRPATPKRVRFWNGNHDRQTTT